MPKEIRPVFKDTSELNPGNLPQQIHDALEQSKHLIVICSPRSAKSEWVNREVETFIGMGKTDCIIPFIIDGKAFAKDPNEECFPEALRNLPAEQGILGANISEMGRDAAAVKVVAQMFGLKFDELWQRYDREQRRKRILTTMGISTLVLVALIVTGWIWKQRTTIRMENWFRMENEAKYVSEIANDLTDKGRSYEAQRALIEVLPKDLEHPDRPWVPAAEKALRYAFSHDIVFIDGDYRFVDFSPDGKAIITSKNDTIDNDTILVLDAKTGKIIRKLKSGNGNLKAAFSPDGKKILSYGNSIGIIDADNGNQLIKLIGHDENIDCANFSPDGKMIVSSSIDGTVRLWDAENGKELWRLNWEDARCSCYGELVAFSPDGKQILGLSDHFIRIWDAENAQEKFVIKNGEAIIQEIYDENGEYLDTYYEDDDAIRCACYTPDGEIIFVSTDDSIKAWNVENGKVFFSFMYKVDKETPTINYVDISVDRQLLNGFDKDFIYCCPLKFPKDKNTSPQSQ